MIQQEKFHRIRERMNEKLLTEGNLENRQNFGLDNLIHADGRLSCPTRDLLGQGARGGWLEEG